MNTNLIEEKLISIFGAENVKSDYGTRYCNSFDSTNSTEGVKVCSFVVYPKSSKELSELMKFANSEKIPIISRGSGTNLVGGCCVYDESSIVVDFLRMNKIKSINKENLTAVVEPGVIVDDLKKAVLKEGLFYPPDPSNSRVSSMGGSIALSSGGAHSFKYGTTKDYVLDLEVVTAEGKIFHTGSSCAKNVTGYNLTQLFVGSEGTLGLITEATLRLIPKPESSKIFLAYFNTLEDAAKSVNGIISALIMPSVCDLMDKNTLNTIEKFYPSGLLTDKEAALLIEVDGFNNSLESQSEKIKNICIENGCSHFQNPIKEKEIEKIWTARRSSFGAMAKLAPNVCADDFVVPRENIVSEITGIKKICDKYFLKVGIMGHIGDGNIHPNIALDLSNPTEAENLKKARKEMADLTISLNGRLSGEHGIGHSKKDFLEDNLGSVTLNYMKQIKKVFDKNNILNPNKVI